MGLIKEGRRFAVLSDILGDEDHLGDMDFKVAGTETGHHLAADGHQDHLASPRRSCSVALNQARDGRLHILGEMAKALDSHARDGVSEQRAAHHDDQLSRATRFAR